MGPSPSEKLGGMGLLDDKVAFVSGAGRGIGAAAARLFAREGARVLLTARTEAELQAVTGEIRAAGGTAACVVCDLADPPSVQAAVDEAVTLFGRLDVAFNNGAAIQPPGPMDDLPLAAFDHLYRVNLRGVWLAMTAQVRAFSGAGAIVNNSSVGSLRSNPVLPAGRTRRDRRGGRVAAQRPGVIRDRRDPAGGRGCGRLPGSPGGHPPAARRRAPRR